MPQETWLEFRLYEDEEEPTILTCLIPKKSMPWLFSSMNQGWLADLKIELCPTRMSEGCFWKIYFVLLYSKLSERHGRTSVNTPGCGSQSKLVAGIAKSGKARIVENLTGLASKKEGFGSYSPEEKKFSTQGSSSTPYAQGGPLLPEFGKPPVYLSLTLWEKHPTEIMEKDTFLGVHHLKTMPNDDDDDEWPEEETGEWNNTS